MQRFGPRSRVARLGIVALFAALLSPVLSVGLPSTAVAGPADDYRAAVLADDPLAYWRLQETSGSTASDAAGLQDGAIVGGVALGVPGPMPGSRAMAFDQSTGRIEVWDPALKVANVSAGGVGSHD